LPCLKLYFTIFVGCINSKTYAKRDSMPYQVLARKWRPKNFAEMVGQQATVRTLSNALENNRLHHAYLFTGTRGVGKTTIARIIAKCLNCEQGISPTPCNQCATCGSIDAGKFVDLIEVDAASRTKVEDTRELLDNVQYAPSQGRFKIYLIDEVHMLSGHSFNALLKTLEEPPEHVKFLLATTDPQKLPITVLSRCLQFHLKWMTPEVITQHLQHILSEEKITAEALALNKLAEAANGSMRDALSLLDQAIAFSNANITLDAVQQLLGATATLDLFPLLDALHAQDGSALLAHIEQLTLQGANFSQVLSDFLSLLHQIAIAQTIPAANIGHDAAAITDYAKQYSAEDIQLFYQIGLLGKRDLPYAPSVRSGFEMTLLRMLRFMPDINAQTTPDKSENSTKKITPATTTAVAEKKTMSAEWSSIISELKLGGMTKVLAENCVLDKKEGNHLQLHIEPRHASLANVKQIKQLETALSEFYASAIKVDIAVENLAKETPAAATTRQQHKKLDDAKHSITNDPHVQHILQEFGGSLDEKSIKSLKN